MGRALAAAIAAAILLLVAPARAQRCGDAGRAWIARCAAATGVAMKLDACPAGVAVVGTEQVRVEISTKSSGLVRENGYAVTPIGEFADWQLEPESRRRAFDAVVSCVAREAPRPLLEADAPAPDAIAKPSKPPAPPWLLAASVLLAIAATIRTRRAALIAITSVLATFAIRRVLVPFAFFHQNGQGPLWIEFAMLGDAGAYGPGYAEIFGSVARGARPERGVAILQEVLAATMPLSAFALARAARSSRATSLAAVIAIAIALDPVLVRVARSESYFSATAALLFAAAAVLVVAVRQRRLVGLMAAGLLVAEAARVHPVAWIPAALVPLALFACSGSTRERAARVGVAALAIGLIATPLVLPTLRIALASELGAFAGDAHAVLSGRAPAAVATAVIGAALAWRQATRPFAPIAVVVAVAIVADPLSRDAAVVRVADLHLFAPAVVAALGAASLRPAPLAAAVAAAVAMIAGRALVVLPTDAREQSWALEWRETLSAKAEVASVSRAGRRVLVLPLAGEGQPIARDIDEAGVARFGGGPRFYYRGSICATAEGAPRCAAFERANALTPIVSRRLPAIASLPWEPLPPGEIEVALFRIAGDAPE